MFEGIKIKSIIGLIGLNTTIVLGMYIISHMTMI